MVKPTLLAFSLLSPLLGFVASKAIPFENHKNLGKTYPYAVHIPTKDKANPPVNLFLHGMGSRGEAGEMDELVTWNGPGRRLKEFYDGNITASSKIVAESFLTVMPVAPKANEPEWDLEGVMKVLEDVKKKYKHDPKRIYLSGYSMGARDAWKLLLAHPTSFTAAAISAGEPSNTTDLRPLLNIPLAHYCGTKDTESSSSLSHGHQIQSIIEKAGGRKAVLVPVEGPEPLPAHNAMANKPFEEPMYSELLRHVGLPTKAGGHGAAPALASAVAPPKEGKGGQAKHHEANVERFAHKKRIGT